MVAYLDLNIYQNEDFTADIALSKYISKLQFDAGEYEIKGSIKKHHKSNTASAVFGVSFDKSSYGLFTIYLNPTQTSAMKYGKYVYDVFVKDKSKNIARYSYEFDGRSKLTLSYKNPILLNLKNFIFEFYVKSSDEISTLIDMEDSLKIKLENGVVVLYNDGIEILRSDDPIPKDTWVKISAKRYNNKIAIFYDDVEMKFVNDSVNFGSSSKILIGEDFIGLLSNLIIIINDDLPVIKYPIVNNSFSGLVLLTCRDILIRDNSILNPDIINTGVTWTYQNPFGSDIVTYKLIEGVAYVNPSVTNF